MSERHVVEQVHVRVKRVGLEDHRDAAFGQRYVVHHARRTNAQLAAIHFFQPGNGAAAWTCHSPGPDEDDELAVLDVQVDAFEDLLSPQLLTTDRICTSAINSLLLDAVATTNFNICATLCWSICTK